MVLLVLHIIFNNDLVQAEVDIYSNRLSIDSIGNISNISTGTVDTSGYGNLTNTLTVLKRSNVVTISGSVTFSDTGYYTIGIVSSGFRPKNTVYGLCIINYSSQTNWRLVGSFNINSNGVFRAAIDTAGAAYLSISYIIS